MGRARGVPGVEGAARQDAGDACARRASQAPTSHPSSQQRHRVVGAFAAYLGHVHALRAQADHLLDVRADADAVVPVSQEWVSFEAQASVLRTCSLHPERPPVEEPLKSVP